MHSLNKKLALIICAALLYTPQAQAETKVVKRDEFRVMSKVSGCDIDMKQHCQDVTAGNNREILCLMAHEDKLLPSCQMGLAEAALGLEMGVATLDYAHANCGSDRAKLCGKVEAGEGRLIQCFKDHKDKVSATCQTALKNIGIWDHAIEPAAGK